MQKISITRALVELKRLDERISQSVLSGVYVGITQGLNDKKVVHKSNQSIQAVSAAIQSSFDKVDALTKNRAELKGKIVLSNAVTQVTINGRTMSVAEAIELKSTASARKQFLQMLRNSFTNAKNTVDRENAVLQETIDKHLTTLYGSDKTKVDQEAAKSVSEFQKSQKQLELLDPAGIEKRIEALQEEISVLESELDFVLSESNARTEIEVTF